MNDLETAVQRQRAYDLEIEAQIAAGTRRKRWIIGVACVVLATIVGAFAVRTVSKLMEPELVAEDHFRQASADEAKGDFLSASKALKRVLANATDNVEARVRLSNAYLAVGDGLSARKEFDAAVAEGYQADDYAIHRAKLMLWDRAYTDVLLALVSEANSAKKSVLQGQAYLGLGQLDKAAGAFGAALELTPGDVAASLGMVRLALARGESKQARVALEKIAKTDVAPHSLLILSGVIALTQGDYARADSDFTQLRNETVGISPAALVGLTQIALARDEIEVARKQLNAIPRYYAKSTIIGYLRAVIALRGGDTHESRTKLLDLLKRSPNYTDGLMLLVRIAYSEQDFGQARARLRTVIENSPNKLEPQLMMAMVQLQLGQLDDALEILTAGVQKFPHSPIAHALLSRALIRNNQVSEADAQMNQARELANNQGLPAPNASQLLALDSAWLPVYCHVPIDECPNCLTLRDCH